MFIPAILIDLKNKRDGNRYKAGYTTHSMACCFIILKRSIDMCEKKGLMEIFQASCSTINRSLRWLNENGMLPLEGKKTKEVRPVYNVGRFAGKAMPVLVSSVEKAVFTDPIPDAGLRRGINALSEYTLINKEYQEMFAVGKASVRHSDIPMDREYGTFRMEVWKYGPKLSSHTATVDKLSLHPSLKDSEDERVQIELDNPINDIKW